MRYVITPDVAIDLVARPGRIAPDVRLVAPTLLRSQVLSILYERARSDQLAKREADAILDGIRGLRVRLLGDRVLQASAWRAAAELNWPDTFDAEYIALTTLQADAFVTLDARLRAAASKLVPVAEIGDLRLP